MSCPRLPGELLDRIVDFLDNTVELRHCCLVSSAWIPRTRRHLFAAVKFYSSKQLQSWRTTFADPSTSPARYTEFLIVSCPEVATVADGEEGGWITTFSNVTRLRISVTCVPGIGNPEACLVPFHGFSPRVKSLQLECTCVPVSPVSDFVRSFPLLEDLAVFNDTKPEGVPNNLVPQPAAVIRSSDTSPVFTGALVLSLKIEMGVRDVTFSLSRKS